MLCTRFEPPIESASDILSRDLPMTVPRASLPQIVLAYSPLPIIQRLYAKTELFEYPNAKIPKDIVERVDEGKAVTVGNKIDLQLEGHKYHYAKESFAVSHAGYIFPKNHWLKVMCDL